MDHGAMEPSEDRLRQAAAGASVRWMVPEADATRLFVKREDAKKFALKKSFESRRQGKTVKYNVIAVSIQQPEAKRNGSPDFRRVVRHESSDVQPFLREFRDQLLDMVSERNRFLARLDEIEKRVDARLAKGSSDG